MVLTAHNGPWNRLSLNSQSIHNTHIQYGLLINSPIVVVLWRGTIAPNDVCIWMWCKKEDDYIEQCVAINKMPRENRVRRIWLNHRNFEASVTVGYLDDDTIRWKHNIWCEKIFQPTKFKTRTKHSVYRPNTKLAPYKITSYRYNRGTST